MGSSSNNMGSNDTILWFRDEYSIKYESKIVKGIYITQVDEARN